MNRRDLLTSCCACVACSVVAVGTLGLTSRASAEELPRTVGGIKLPDSALCKEATALAMAIMPKPLFNHSVRTYIFGAAWGARTNRVFDEETLYLASVLHDLGLVDPYIKDARFEVDGADAARSFLTERSYPKDKADLIWEAIAMHSTLEIPDRMRAEVALVHNGVFMDAGRNADKFPPSFYTEVFGVLPRLGNKQQIATSIAEVIRRKPHTASLAFQVDIGRKLVPGFNPPNYFDIKPRPPFDQ